MKNIDKNTGNMGRVIDKETIKEITIPRFLEEKSRPRKEEEKKKPKSKKRIAKDKVMDFKFIKGQQDITIMMVLKLG